MEQRHEILFTPMSIGNVEIKNRFIMCPMEGTSIVEWFKSCKFMDTSRDFYIDRRAWRTVYRGVDVRVQG